MAKRWRKRLLKAGTLLAALLVLAWWTFLYVNQDALLFPGHFMTLPAPIAPSAGTIAWKQATPAGTVDAWYSPAPGATPDHPAPLVVYVHGNAEIIGQELATELSYRAMGCSVLQVEFPGFGESTGYPTQPGIRAALAAALDHVLERPEVDASRLVYHGRSVGGAVAADLVAHRKPVALIFESTFYSGPAMAHTYLAPGFLLRNQYRTDRVVRAFAGPILVIHGTRDHTIPVRQARWLAQSNPRARLVTYPTDHNDLHNTAGRAIEIDFWNQVRATLIEAHVLAPEGAAITP